MRYRSERGRLVDAIQAWGGPPIDLLPLADPDLAVAHNTIAYALAMKVATMSSSQRAR